MRRPTPARIGFEEYSRHIPDDIPVAIGQATDHLLKNRASRVAEVPEWEELRQAASDIRMHTLTHLDFYLREVEARATAAGVHVHWARDSQEARDIVVSLARSHRVRTVVKAKSMATEEIGLNSALGRAGIESLETDLGEFIVQLSGTCPSHIIVPAVHLKKEAIAALFKEKLGIDVPADAGELASTARRVLRAKFLSAEMGVSGANFLVAESATQVIVTNEGNGRMCTSLPAVHVAIVGIEKVIPNWQALEVFLRLLARSATGQKMTTYVSFISGANGLHADYGEQERHLVLLDNGRSNILRDPVGREALKCIRCGACLNICPVYRSVGGFAYGSFISGPIGAILLPQLLGCREARELPFASTLCGACAETCPVKIPIPDLLRHLRRRVADGDEFGGPSLPWPVRWLSGGVSFALAMPLLYSLAMDAIPAIGRVMKRGDWIWRAPFPISRWTSVRPLPAFRAGFRKWWRGKK